MASFPKKRHYFIGLDSGATLLFLPQKKLKGCQIKAYVKCGNINEQPSNFGISHLMEHMLFKGNRILGNSNQLNFLFESLPGDLNASTDFRFTTYSYSFSNYNFQLAIKYFCQLLFQPLFTDFEHEKKIIIEELKADLNQQNQITSVQDIVCSLIWPRHALGQPVIGSMQTIKKIDLVQLDDFYRHYYHPQNILFTIVGDLPMEPVIKIINSNVPIVKKPFTKYIHPPIEQLQDSDSRHSWVVTNDAQLDIVWAFPFSKLKPSQLVMIDVCSHLLYSGLSSFLPRNVREQQGLVYDIVCSYFNYDLQGYLAIQSQVSISKLQRFCSYLTSIMYKLVLTGFEQWELDVFLRRKNDEIYCLSDDPYNYLEQKITDFFDPQLSSKYYKKQIQKLTLVQINNFFAEFMIKQKPVVAVVGPKPNASKLSYKKVIDTLLNWPANQAG